MRIALIAVLFLVLVAAVTAPASVAAFSGAQQSIAASPAYAAAGVGQAGRDIDNPMLRLAIVGTQSPMRTTIPQTGSMIILMLGAWLVSYRRRPAPRPPTPESTDY